MCAAALSASSQPIMRVHSHTQKQACDTFRSHLFIQTTSVKRYLSPQLFRVTTAALSLVSTLAPFSEENSLIGTSDCSLQGEKTY